MNNECVMKSRKKILVFLMVGIVLVVACQSKKEKLNAQIAAAEKEVVESYKTEAVNRLLTLYQKYTAAFPEDSLAVEYLFRSAEFNMRLNKGEEALANLDAVITKYPDSWRVPECYFLKGFVYEDVLYDLENAENAYYEFVAHFPSHKLARDASLAISYLGKSPEEIVASFNDSTLDVVE